MLIRFLLSLFLSAVAINCLATDEEDTVSSGNYLIQFCDSELPKSNAAYLQQLLPQIYANLLVVIADARRGLASRYGYGAFFKTNFNIEEVVRVYQHMADGTDMLIQSTPGSNHPGLMEARPTFVCINATAPLLGACFNSNPAKPVVTWEDSNLIALCPSFWDRKMKPVPRTDCPRRQGNTLSSNGMALSLNQEAMIVQNLAWKYQNGSAWYDGIANMQDIMALNATASLKSAQMFALYYAGECNYTRLLE